ncbi:hypothetical protein EDC04DRAFT_2605447 [Pisolithus marmoratus]|nr:hypothetical protein EDC04DRAFT_2605447 [Pisolithus marmoratus]
MPLSIFLSTLLALTVQCLILMMARTVQNAKKSPSGHAKHICKAKDARTHQLKVCQQCLGLVDIDTTSLCNLNVHFICLGCHEVQNRLKKSEKAPYIGFTWMAGGALDPMLPEGIYVKGICERASNSQLLEVALEEYHTDGTLQCEQIVFDFRMQKKFVWWSVTTNKLANSLILSPFTCKVIFISTHSDVECGDLFAGQGDDGTDTAMEVTMITKSFMAMKDAVKFLKPEFADAFDATNFISTMLKMFLLTYCSCVLIKGQNFLTLPQAPFLTTLSTTMEASQPALVGYWYTWFHSHKQPWGVSLPMGCLGCHSVHTWGESTHDPKLNPKDHISQCMKACLFHPLNVVNATNHYPWPQPPKDSPVTSTAKVYTTTICMKQRDQGDLTTLVHISALSLVLLLALLSSNWVMKTLMGGDSATMCTRHHNLHQLLKWRTILTHILREMVTEIQHKIMTTDAGGKGGFMGADSDNFMQQGDHK